MKEKLNRVSIKGFKSIRDSSVDLGNINILIGRNGSGKSNFLYSFSLLQSILDKEFPIQLARNGADSMLYNGRDGTGIVRMDFDFTCGSYGFTLEPTGDGQLELREEYRRYNGMLSSTNTSCILTGTHPDENPDGNDANPIYLLEGRPWRMYLFHDTSRVRQGNIATDDRILEDDASNLVALLNRLRLEYPDRYRDILNTVRLVEPSISDFVLEPHGPNGERIDLRWRRDGCGDVFDASQLSDGTIRFICLTTLMLQPLELQPATIVIDEPELGLHPYGTVLFADMVRQVSEHVQVTVSTQSVELLNQFDVDDVILTEMTTNGTVLRRLDGSEVESWLDDGYSLGDLWQKNLLGCGPLWDNGRSDRRYGPKVSIGGFGR